MRRRCVWIYTYWTSIQLNNTDPRILFLGVIICDWRLTRSIPNFIVEHNRRNQNPPLSPVYTCNNSPLLRPAVLFAVLAIPRLTGFIVWRGGRNSIVDGKCHSPLRCVPVLCCVRCIVFYAVLCQLWYVCGNFTQFRAVSRCRPGFTILVRDTLFFSLKTRAKCTKPNCGTSKYFS